MRFEQVNALKKLARLNYNIAVLKNSFDDGLH